MYASDCSYSSASFCSILDAYILQMNGKSMNKSPKKSKSKLSNHGGDMKVATKPFRKWFVSPVRASLQLSLKMVYSSTFFITNILHLSEECQQFSGQNLVPDINREDSSVSKAFETNCCTLGEFYKI